MSDENKLIINSLNQLHSDQQTGFQDINERLDRLNGRVRKNELAITRIKTIGAGAAAVLTFFGWDSVKVFIGWTK